MMDAASENIFLSDLNKGEFDPSNTIFLDEHEDHEDAIGLLTCDSVIRKLRAALTTDSTPSAPPTEPSAAEHP
jgi:hypothetical protein